MLQYLHWTMSRRCYNMLYSDDNLVPTLIRTLQPQHLAPPIPAVAPSSGGQPSSLLRGQLLLLSRCFQHALSC